MGVLTDVTYSFLTSGAISWDPGSLHESMGGIWYPGSGFGCIILPFWTSCQIYGKQRFLPSQKLLGLSVGCLVVPGRPFPTSIPKLTRGLLVTDLQVHAVFRGKKYMTRLESNGGARVCLCGHANVVFYNLNHLSWALFHCAVRIGKIFGARWRR